MFLALIATGGEAASASAFDLMVIGAVGGATIGAAQWLVLRRLFHRAGWWVLASAKGVAAGVFSYSVLTGSGTQLFVLLAGGGAGGAITALSPGVRCFGPCGLFLANGTA
jgi:hypothetical protein